MNLYTALLVCELLLFENTIQIALFILLFNIVVERPRLGRESAYIMNPYFFSAKLY